MPLFTYSAFKKTPANTCLGIYSFIPLMKPQPHLNMFYFPALQSDNDFSLTFLLFSAFGINSILYQRGIYPFEAFTRVQKYGLTLLVTTDPELIKYLNNVVEQLKGISLLKTILRFASLVGPIFSGILVVIFQLYTKRCKTLQSQI